MQQNRKTHQQFLWEVLVEVGDEYTPLETYQGAHVKILMRHNTCAHEWAISPGKFLNAGRRCPECARKTSAEKRSLTHTEYVNQVRTLVGEEYAVLGEYVGNGTPIRHKHTAEGCGYEWFISPSNFKYGRRCPRCGVKGRPQNRAKESSQFRHEVKVLVGNEYTHLGDYTGSHNLTLMRHETCGTMYSVSPTNFLSGKRCPDCDQSVGCQKITSFLDRSHYSYVTEYTMPGCHSKRPLRFDFAVFRETGQSLLCLIEFDGLHHFQPVEAWGGEVVYKDTQERDRIKNNFCRVNGICLIRIPYWDVDKIDEILTGMLGKLEEGLRSP